LIRRVQWHSISRGPSQTGTAAQMRSYSQPVLYAHFGSREGILTAVAIDGFQEMGLALEKSRKRVRSGNSVESVGADDGPSRASSMGTLKS
jgi:hypothetical protein